MIEGGISHEIWVPEIWTPDTLDHFLRFDESSLPKCVYIKRQFVLCKMKTFRDQKGSKQIDVQFLKNRTRQGFPRMTDEPHQALKFNSWQEAVTVSDDLRALGSGSFILEKLIGEEFTNPDLRDYFSDSYDHQKQLT